MFLPPVIAPRPRPRVAAPDGCPLFCPMPAMVPAAFCPEHGRAKYYFAKWMKGGNLSLSAPQEQAILERIFYQGGNTCKGTRRPGKRLAVDYSLKRRQLARPGRVKIYVLGLSMGNLNDTTETLHSTLPLIADQTTRPEAARRFTAAFYAFYERVCAGLSEAEQETAERFITGSAHLIEPALPFLDYNLSDRIEARLAAGAQAEDWPIICELRSTLEALKELYAAHLPMDDLIPDDADLDAALKAHAKGDAKAIKPPKGIPDSHWWWALA